MIKHTCVPRSVQFEAAEDTSTNVSANATMGEIIAERLSRRDLAKGILAVSAMAAAVSPLASLAGAGKASAQGSEYDAFLQLQGGGLRRRRQALRRRRI